MIIKKKYIFIVSSLIAFCIGFLIIAQHSKSIPIHENTITDYIQWDDLPFFKNYLIFFDLIYGFLFFIIIFSCLDLVKNSILRNNLKILWIIKNFFSLFIILLYEKGAGLDQVIYFDIINNDKYWAQHYGYLYNFINFESATSNFLLVFKYINIFLFNTWFAVKLFLNLIYISIIYLSYKIYLEINKNDSITIFYLFAFFPSLFFFTSIITKDIFILFYIILSFYCLQKIGQDFRKNLKYFIVILICIFLIMTIRIWMAPLILISFIVPYFLSYIFKILKNYNPLFFLFLFILIFICFLFFLESDIWNNFQIDIIIKQFDRIYNWHHWNPNEHNIIGINSGSIKELLINDFWKMMFLTIFNPFLNNLDKFNFYPFIIENIFIITLIIYSSFSNQIILDKKLCSIILLVIGYSILYSFAGGYLNSGTSLRYSLQVKYLIYIYLISVNKNLIRGIEDKIFYFLTKKLR